MLHGVVKYPKQNVLAKEAFDVKLGKYTIAFVIAQLIAYHVIQATYMRTTVQSRTTCAPIVGG